ncbi:ribonuclease Z [Bacillus alkalisoli]|uniref:ribonuclease Z n=1 Tax=Bacillus alkalisoli TaxID=2011008 RepID=UPI000C23C8AA|nr:ribonuclease Z [Bacillus alkalisoli]
MKITFLGTGSGVPAKHRNVSSLALHLENKDGAIWLFDCGEATQHQILHTSLKPRRIEKIFITHLHGDHIFGLPGLLGSRSFQGGETPLALYGPLGVKEFVETSLRVSGTHLKYEISFHEFEEEGMLLDDEEYVVRVAPLEHGLPSFGFRIEEKEMPGPLLMDKVKEACIPVGPLLKQIKAGLTIQLEDGRMINGADFLGAPKKGRVITILGDTRFHSNSITLSENADVLIHEATFAGADELLASQYFHSTTKQAAEVAQVANVGLLILNHISSRYQAEHMEQLLSEAREIFPNTTIAEDFLSIEIK